MKENYIKKIKTLGKVGGVISIVAQVLVIIAIVGTLVGATVLVVLPEDLFKMGIGGDVRMSMDLSDLGVKFTEEEQAELIESMEDEDLQVDVNGKEVDELIVEATEGGFVIIADSGMYEFSLRDVGLLMYTAVIYQVMTLITIIFTGKLCKAFRDCESPFDMNVIKKMQVLAWSLVPWAIIGSIVDSLNELVFSGKLNLVFNFDFGIIFVIVLILCITYIFKYGAMLQQESDETL